MNLHRTDTAVVFIDPQNEVLSEKGAPWPLIRESLRTPDPPPIRSSGEETG